MKAISGTFIPAEDVAMLLERLETKIDELTKTHSAEPGMQTVWATQKTLAKRYDMSSSSMCRYLAPWVTSGKVRRIRPSDGQRQGDYRYNMEDVDNCIAVFHSELERKAVK